MHAARPQGADRHPPKAEFLTRWGADPVHVSGSLAELIPADAFKSAVKRTTTPLKLPLEAIDKDGSGGVPSVELDQGCPNDPPASVTLTPANTVDVAVACYRPLLEPRRGDLWYCDLPIDPQRSYFPFIRLGLARYQEQSIKGLELSYPVAEWAESRPDARSESSFSRTTTSSWSCRAWDIIRATLMSFPIKRSGLDHPVFRIRSAGLPPWITSGAPRTGR